MQNDVYFHECKTHFVVYDILKYHETVLTNMYYEDIV